MHSRLSHNFLSISSITTFKLTLIQVGTHNSKCIVLHKLRKFDLRTYLPPSKVAYFEFWAWYYQNKLRSPIQPKASQMLEYQYDPSSIDCRVHGVVAGSSAPPTPWVAQLEGVDPPYQRGKGEEGNNLQAELISANPNRPRTIFQGPGATAFRCGWICRKG